MVKRIFTLDLPETRRFPGPRTEAFISELSIMIKNPGAHPSCTMKSFLTAQYSVIDAAENW